MPLVANLALNTPASLCSFVLLPLMPAHTHTSHQAIKASRVPRVHKQLKSHWVAQLWQSEKEPSIPTQSPSLQAPQGVLAAPISHPRGDAPGSAAGKDLFMFENVKLL